MNIFKWLDKKTDILNKNRYLPGIIIIILMMGSKYIPNELSESHEVLFNNIIIRRIVIFLTIFMTTKNVLLSIILTLTFIIFITLTHNKSSCCILPNELKTKNKKKQNLLPGQDELLNIFRKVP